MAPYQWQIYAILSAVAAAFVGIFGKAGMPPDMDTRLATAVRSGVMTLLLAGVCTVAGVWGKAQQFSGKHILMISLAGLAGATSWLFYFRAIQLADVSKVAPIDKLSMPLAIVLAVLILGERPSWVNWAGIGLIVAGAYLAALPAKG